MNGAGAAAGRWNADAYLGGRADERKYTVKVRTDVFGRAAVLAGYRSDYSLARAMGLNRSTVARVRTGELRPGARFISGALTALAPMEFEDLFEVETKY